MSKDKVHLGFPKPGDAIPVPSDCDMRSWQAGYDKAQADCYDCGRDA